MLECLTPCSLLSCFNAGHRGRQALGGMPVSWTTKPPSWRQGGRMPWVAWVGLDGSGKTTAIASLLAGPKCCPEDLLQLTRPATLGPRASVVATTSAPFVALDLPGAAHLRSAWVEAVGAADAVVLVVAADDDVRLPMVRGLLWRHLLPVMAQRGTPLLVLLSRKDVLEGRAAADAVAPLAMPQLFPQLPGQWLPGGLQTGTDSGTQPAMADPLIGSRQRGHGLGQGQATSNGSLRHVQHGSLHLGSQHLGSQHGSLHLGSQRLSHGLHSDRLSRASGGSPRQRVPLHLHARGTAAVGADFFSTGSAIGGASGAAAAAAGGPLDVEGLVLAMDLPAVLSALSAPWTAVAACSGSFHDVSEGIEWLLQSVDDVRWTREQVQKRLGMAQMGTSAALAVMPAAAANARYRASNQEYAIQLAQQRWKPP